MSVCLVRDKRGVRKSERRPRKMRLGSEEELENGVGVAGRTAEQEMVTC